MSPTTPHQPHPRHSARAKSISSLPPPHRAFHRLTPSTSCASSSASDKSHSLSRNSSVRSRPTSPSRLPPTNSVSYFPPFESMGSDCGEDDDDDNEDAAESSSTGAARHRTHGHAKGRSLGSIAGIMSASFTWGLSTLAPCTSPPKDDSPSSTSAHSRHGSSADCDAVVALTKRCTPGKRRVLEPLPLADDLNHGADSRRGRGEVKQGDSVPKHKRRMKSEFEVDRLVLGMSAAARWRKLELDEDDEGAVEGLVDDTPSHPRDRTGRERPLLQVPIPSFPNWRFPLPSPPVTCLSPEIPLEAFDRAIDNPAASTPASVSAGNSPRVTVLRDSSQALETAKARSKSSASEETFNSNHPSQTELDVDEIDDDLLPSPTTTCSQPATPPKIPGLGPHGHVDIKHATPHNQSSPETQWNRNDMNLGLTRTSSQLSCETVRPFSTGNGTGTGKYDVTPKAKKTWAGLSQAVHDQEVVSVIVD